MNDFDGQSDVKQLIKTAVFRDIVASIWSAIDQSEDPSVGLVIISDLLMEAGHSKAASALLGKVKSKRTNLTWIIREASIEKLKMQANLEQGSKLLRIKAEGLNCPEIDKA